MNPRLAFLIGVVFIVDAFIYFLFPYLTGFHIDYAGITMLLFLSVAMSIVFYVLIAGSPSGGSES